MANIREALKKINGEGGKRQISMMIDERNLRMADVIIEQFRNLTTSPGLGLPNSRNQLIEMALEEYLQEAAQALLEENFINIEELLEDQNNDSENTESNHSKNNLVVFPAKNWGFESVFMDQRKWYSLRIADWRVEKNTIRYVACYRTAPHSAITHYAEVDKIKKIDDDSGKYVIYFKGDPKPLEKEVGRGDSWMGLRNIAYTSLDKLRNARDIWDL